MAQIITNVGLFVIFGLILSVLSHGKVFRFRKASNGSIQFSFNPRKGTEFKGPVYTFFQDVRLFIDDRGTVYWVELTDAELNSTRSIRKTALPANRTKDGIAFKDDYQEYNLNISEDGMSTISVVPYVTWWDFSNVCFDNIFNRANQTLIVRFRLVSTNNNLKYDGTTKIDSDNPLRRTFDVRDEHRTGEYEVIFTAKELASTNRVCKNVTALSETLTLAPSLADYIDPSLIKSLIG